MDKEEIKKEMEVLLLKLHTPDLSEREKVYGQLIELRTAYKKLLVDELLKGGNKK